MPSIGRLLADICGNSRRLVILGAGSVLKADDAAGVLVAEKLIHKYGESCSERLKVFSGSTAPENYTGAIKDFQPDHILLIDAADFDEQPGTLSVIQPEVVSGISFSTHMLPLKVMLEYLRLETGAQTTIIGVQSSDITFGAPMTAEVKKTVSYLTATLDRLLKRYGLIGGAL